MTKIGRVILIFIVLNIIVYASDEKVTAVLSKPEIYIDETIILSIIINGSSSASVNPPEIKNLIHIGTSRQKELNYSGGIKSTKTIYSYTYRAEKIGSYEIDIIPIRIRGETYYTKPLFLNVKDRQIAPSQNSNTGSRLFNNILSFMDEDNDTIDNSIFLHSEITKTNIYVYEPIYFEQSVYIRNNLNADVVSIANVGNKNNFLVKEDNNEYVSRAEILNNKAYFVHLLNREVLLPILPGEHDIRENTYIFNVSSKSIGFNDRIEKGGKKLTVNVLPLPTKNKPKNFSDAVGNFDFELSFNTNSVKVGKPFLLRVMVWGEGFTDIIKLPDISKMLLEKYKNSGLKIYSPKQYLTNEIRGGKIYSEKIIEYMMVVNENRNNIIKKIEINPQIFSFFSTKLDRYVILKTKKISLSINGSGISGDNTANNKIISTSNTKDIIDKNKIMPIKTGIIKPSSRNMFIFSDMFIFIYLSISIFIIFIIYLTKKIIIPYFLNKKEQAKKLSFNNAIEYLSKGDIKNYIKEIEAIFYKNISSVLSKDVFSKSSMENALKISNIDIDIQNKSIKIIEQCNYILYSPKEDESIKNYNYHNEMKTIINSITFDNKS